MNTDEQILATLQKLLENQEQTLALQRQAVERQQVAVKNQLATGRLYRIALVVLAIFLAALSYFLYREFLG